MSNPLLDDLDEAGVMPDSSVTLPTMGRFYHEGVFAPGVDFADITIKSLSLLDENLYKDPVLLASGTAMRKLLSRVCPELYEAGELAEVDIEAIMLAVRLTSYGPDLNLTHTCRNPKVKADVQDSDLADSPDGGFICREKNEIKVDVLEFLMRYQVLDNLDDYTMVLDGIGQTVKLRPVSYDSTMRVLKDIYKSSRKFENMTNMTVDEAVFDEDIMQSYVDMIETTVSSNIDALVNSIMSVTARSGIEYEDPETIRDWLKELPKEQLDQIRTRIDDLTTKLKKIPELDYNCPHCQYKNTLFVQLDPQMLFLPAGDMKAPKKSSAQSKRTGKKGKTQSKVLPR